VRSYEIYWIKDEFASYFYGRERAFYQLFYEGEFGTSEQQRVAQNQIAFITKPMPSLAIHRLLIQSLQKRKGFTSDGIVYRLDLPGKKGSVLLEVGDRKLSMKASGRFDGESMMFEGLESFEGRLLAIDLRNIRYGWLQPQKERKFV